ncbi:unnamed protein product [Echinostoma caproni]|uniref:Integral membrane protein n=1 Tax=Echinostoma caproni TaxID=27848 RepID=A0A183AP28_9TREM|nr:unnamed protein product [Echinostoma caproni]
MMIIDSRLAFPYGPRSSSVTAWQVKLHAHYSIHNHMLLASLWLSCIGLLLTSIHLAVFSFDGRGLGGVSELGTFSTQWGDALFLALLLSTAEVGFLTTTDTVRSRASNSIGADHRGPVSGTRDYAYHALTADTGEGSSSPEKPSPRSCGRSSKPWPFLISLIALFLCLQTILYGWASIDQDPVIDFSVWNTVPGCLLLAVRFAVAFWFLAILRRRRLGLDTMGRELDEAGDVLLGPGIDLIHFAAFFLLWMLLLPLVVFIAETSVSSLWRRKTIAKGVGCGGVLFQNLFSNGSLVLSRLITS